MDRHWTPHEDQLLVQRQWDRLHARSISACYQRLRRLTNGPIESSRASWHPNEIQALKTNSKRLPNRSLAAIEKRMSNMRIKTKKDRMNLIFGTVYILMIIAVIIINFIL